MNRERIKKFVSKDETRPRCQATPRSPFKCPIVPPGKSLFHLRPPRAQFENAERMGLRILLCQLLDEGFDHFAKYRLKLFGCIEIAGGAEAIARSIVPELRMVERQFHVAGKRHRSTQMNFTSDEVE